MLDFTIVLVTGFDTLNITPFHIVCRLLKDRKDTDMDNIVSATKAVLTNIQGYNYYTTKWHLRTLMKVPETGICCYICGDTKEMVIDHCHTKGLIRGILCGVCNHSIGYFQENTGLITNAYRLR